MIRLSAPLSACFAALTALAACKAADAPRTPEEICGSTCAERATRCSAADCARGCNLSLDRLIEGEGDKVIECVAKSTSQVPDRACDDAAWAHCAVMIGPHLDGGPPSPPPAPPD